MGPSISQCYHSDDLCLQTPPCGMRCDVTLEELLCSCTYALAHLLLLMTVIVCFPLHVSRHVNKETDRSLPLLTSACKRTACLIFGKSGQRPFCQEVLRLALYFLIEKAPYDISHSFLPAPR
jgi:hypothetical protein